MNYYDEQNIADLKETKQEAITSINFTNSACGVQRKDHMSVLNTGSCKLMYWFELDIFCLLAFPRGMLLCPIEDGLMVRALFCK